jgi:dTDP-4-amino-4,6-dideoxygalactose transaminase
MKTHVHRREFLKTSTLAGAGLALGTAAYRPLALGAESTKPALLGGKPLVSEAFPDWPVYDETEEKALQTTLRSGHWFRGSGNAVAGFENAYAKLTGAKHCLATSCGTSALSTALGALDIGPGDEVIIPPYTFVATYNVVVLNYALPIFVDTDIETFQIDAKKIEAAINAQTRAIMPVHLGGSVADLDNILAIAGQHQLPVVEDACQAHLTEWKGRKVGTWGLAGCFSFQASKNLNSGEGGALLTNDDEFSEICFNFHNQGRARQSKGYTFAYSGTRGSNLRLAEFQGSLLVAQMTRLEAQTRRRTENAEYLTRLLREIPGITPAKMYPGCTRNAYHLYMFRLDKEAFGLERAKFMQALQREGVPCSSGYSPLNQDKYVRGLTQSRHYRKLYTESELKRWEERNVCPRNEALCSQAVWFTQNMLLGSKNSMEQIAEAIRRIQQHAAEIAKV